MDFFKQTPHYNRSCNNELCKGSSDPDDLRNELRGMTGIEYEVLKSEGGISVIQERYREGPSKTRSTKVFYVMDDVTFSQASKNEDLVNCDTGETLTEKEWVVKLRERLRGSKGGAGGSGGGGGGGGGGSGSGRSASTNTSTAASSSSSETGGEGGGGRGGASATAGPSSATSNTVGNGSSIPGVKTKLPAGLTFDTFCSLLARSKAKKGIQTDQFNEF